MKRTNRDFRILLFHILLFYALPIKSINCFISSPVLTFIRPRPQSYNGVRKVVNEFGKTHTYIDDQPLHSHRSYWHGNFSLTPAYEHSFNQDQITRALFGSTVRNGTNSHTLKVQGSTANDINRDVTALFADYFYLPTDYESTLSFNPRVTNFILDGNLYLELDQWLPHAYLRVWAPFVHTAWNLDMRENVLDDGMQSLRPGYFTPDAVNRDSLLTFAHEFFAGKAPGTVDGVEFHGLCFSKIDGALCNRKSCGNKTKNGFGEIRAELGWDFVHDNDYHFGLNIQAAAPTGSRPKAEFLFEPIIGNGKHWEIGGGTTGHYVFWREQDKSAQWSLNGDISILHLVKAKERRTFDLRGKPLSRYMLASKVRRVANTDDPNTLQGDDISSIFEFDNVHTPIANLTTRNVKVSVGAQIDMTLWLNYSSRNLSLDFGYNLWFSSGEKIDNSDASFACGCNGIFFEENRWIIKGDAQMFGFQSVDANNVPANTPQPLAASDSKATILTGSNSLATGNPQFTNGRIDRPRLATTNQVVLLNQHTDATTPLAAPQQINTSIQAIRLTQQELDLGLNDNLNRGLSNKIFAHLAYTWKDTNLAPYVGFGASAEFGQTKHLKKCPTTIIVNTSTCCPTALITNSTANCPGLTTCPTTINCALSLWSIWVKGGITF